MVEQPHFDDERTVLTARPVVPLDAIDAKVTHRRRWFLGGAFAIAMLLGTASALISAYLKMRNVPDPEIQSLSVLPVPEETPQLQTVAVLPERPKARPRARDNSSTNEAGPDQAAMIAAPATQRPHLSEKEALRQIRDAVLVDQWQEQRARRVERPELRRAQHRDRNASNIDEIFEGARHP